MLKYPPSGGIQASTPSDPRAQDPWCTPGRLISRVLHTTRLSLECPWYVGRDTREAPHLYGATLAQHAPPHVSEGSVSGPSIVHDAWVAAHMVPPRPHLMPSPRVCLLGRLPRYPIVGHCPCPACVFSRIPRPLARAFLVPDCSAA